MLKMSPHPSLFDTQPKVTALNYWIMGYKINIKIWRALLCNVLKRLGLEASSTARKPQNQQIFLMSTAHLASPPVPNGRSKWMKSSQCLMT